MGLYFGFGRPTWVWKGSKLGFSRIGPGFDLFLAKQVRRLGFLEEFEWVQSSVLVDEARFE